MIRALGHSWWRAPHHGERGRDTWKRGLGRGRAVSALEMVNWLSALL